MGHNIDRCIIKKESFIGNLRASEKECVSYPYMLRSTRLQCLLRSRNRTGAHANGHTLPSNVKLCTK